MGYNEIKGGINVGDIVLFSGEQLYQKAIQYFSKSKWNHIGIVFESYGHLFIIEAVGQGVRIQRLEQKFSEYYGSLRVIRPKWRSDGQNFNLIKNILDNIGNNYDFKGVIAFFIRTMFPKFRWQDKRSQFCSELIARGLESVDYKWTDKPAHLLKPCDFDNQEYFDVVVDNYLIK